MTNENYKISESKDSRSSYQDLNREALLNETFISLVLQIRASAIANRTYIPVSGLKDDKKTS